MNLMSSWKEPSRQVYDGRSVSGPLQSQKQLILRPLQHLVFLIYFDGTDIFFKNKTKKPAMKYVLSLGFLSPFM
jgi:hypothetical protein